MPVTWLCPSCGRRVPESLDECRCGMQRPAAAAVARVAASRSRKLPKDVVILMVVVGLVLVGGVVALFFPYAPTRGIRILGTIDQKPPASPTPSKPKPPAR